MRMGYPLPAFGETFPFCFLFSIQSLYSKYHFDYSY